MNTIWKWVAPAVCACTLALTGCPSNVLGSGASADTSNSASAQNPSTAAAAAATNPDPDLFAATAGVKPSSLAPTASSGLLTATTGATQAGALAGHGVGLLTYAVHTPPQHGTVALTNATTGAFTYASAPNFTGTDSFQFTVANSAGTSQPATEVVQVTSPAIGAERVPANIGVSIDWLCYWCTAQPYVDIVHQAAAFGDTANGTPLTEEGKLDPNGWPEADTRIMIACCTKQDGGSKADPGPTNPLVGKYQLSFNGKAVIWDDGGKVEDQRYNTATNTTTAILDQIPIGHDGTGFDFLLTFTKTQRTSTSKVGSGFTNLKIIRPQYAPNGMKWWNSPTQEFTSPFLDSLKGFSTIRYINWTQVIGSPEVNWSDRTPANWPVAAHYTVAAQSSLPYLSGGSTCSSPCWYATGGSWGSAIAIANATHTDMWIDIPVMASDDYVKSLAALLKAKLDPGLHVYVEWSDEIWNYGNPWWTETSYNVDQTKALLANNPTEAAHYTANCPSAAAECHVAERVMQFSEDFASVYGQSAINTTIRPVLCTQFVQPGYLQAALRFIALTYGTPSKYFYGVCGAPYWGAGKLPAGTTTAGAVAAIDAGITHNDGTFRADTATALFYGLHNLTYEGGPINTGFSVDGDTSGAVGKALATSVQMAPGMQADVIQGLTNAFANGIDMYMFYENESATYYGATVDPLDLDAPKFQGLTATIGQPMTRTVGTTLPATIPIDPPDFTVEDGTISPWAWQLMYCSAGTHGAAGVCTLKGTATPGTGFAYLVNVPKTGTYSFSLVLGPYSTPHGSITLAADQKPVGSFAVTPSSSGTPQTVGPISTTLTSGLHLIEILQDGSYHFSASSIEVTAN